MIAFGDIFVDMLSNEKCNKTVTELFIRGRKLNITLVFISKSYFVVPKNIRLNLTHENKQETNKRTNECLKKSHLTIHQISTFITL